MSDHCWNRSRNELHPPLWLHASRPHTFEHSEEQRIRSSHQWLRHRTRRWPRNISIEGSRNPPLHGAGTFCRRRRWWKWRWKKGELPIHSKFLNASISARKNKKFYDIYKQDSIIRTRQITSQVFIKNNWWILKAKQSNYHTFFEKNYTTQIRNV